MGREELASLITDYMYDVDPYEFKDCYETKEDAYNDNLHILDSKNGVNQILESINEDIKYFDDCKPELDDLCIRAKDIGIKLIDYKNRVFDVGMER